MSRITKEQAAEILGMTTRAVERYTKQNRLSATYERGRTRPVPVYDEAEVKALASSLLHPVQPAIINNDQSDNSERDVVIHSQALQRAGNDEALAMLGKMLAASLQAQAAHEKGKGEQTSIADLSAKMTLSFSEAARLSGVPENHLRAAFAAGSLRGAKIGRGVRVSPDALKAYVGKVLK
jgi:excisionase family DNA binding protein